MEQTWESALVTYCAPTLAGVKPANLFLYRTREGHQRVHETAEQWTRVLAPYGISVSIIKECKCRESYLIYVYRTAWMERILSEHMTVSFLKGLGYVPSRDFGALLRQLSDRLCLEREFPHEIGVFLGYPLFDVVSFMENEGRNYAFCGYWKAYDDPDGARRRSEQYRKCTSIYKNMFQNGTPILRLVVAA